MNKAMIKQFFETYSEVSISSNPTVLTCYYASNFFVAGPQGSATFKNDEAFNTWLTQLHEFNQQVGMRSLEIVSIRDFPINNHHAFVTVEWGARFEKTGDERICFEISYLLEISEDKPLILGYISHEDQEEVMRAWKII